MKAVVVKTKGTDPVYDATYEQSLIPSTDEVLIKVKAVAIKNLDRAIASGKHYTAQSTDFKPLVVGTDGVGILEDGSRVYGFGVSGMCSESAVVKKNSLVKIPNGLSNAVAAALPNALMGSAIALMVRAQLKPGQHVLINGATGITGKIAIQMAKFYGAAKVTVSGRNEEVLKSLINLGADELISLKQSKEALVHQIKTLDSEQPIDVVVDYLWGESAKAILTALKGKGIYTHNTKFVNVGAMSGDLMELSSSILRGTDVQLLGSGLGSWNNSDVDRFYKTLLPQAFELAAHQKLQIDTVEYSMDQVEAVWNSSIQWNSRLVLTLD